MSSSLGIVVGVAGFAPPSARAVEAAVLDVLGDELRRDAGVDASPELVSVHIAASAPIASAWSWFASELRPALVAAARAADPRAVVLAEAYDPDEQSLDDVLPWELVDFELVDDGAITDELLAWIDGGPTGARPGAAERRATIAPLLAEVRWLSGGDEPGERRGARPNAVDRAIQAYHAWSAPARRRVFGSQRGNGRLDLAPPPRAAAQWITELLGPSPTAGSPSPLPGGLYYPFAELPPVADAARRAAEITRERGFFRGAAVVDGLLASLDDAHRAGRGLAARCVTVDASYRTGGLSLDAPAPIGHAWGLPLDEAFLAPFAALCADGVRAVAGEGVPVRPIADPRPWLAPTFVAELPDAAPDGTVELPCSALDLAYADPPSVRIDLRSYWARIGRAWEEAMVRGLFPRVGAGYRLTVADVRRTASDGLEALVRAELVDRAPMARWVVVATRAELDGAFEPRTGAVVSAFAEGDAGRWLDRLAVLSADDVHAAFLDDAVRLLAP